MNALFSYSARVFPVYDLKSRDGEALNFYCFKLYRFDIRLFIIELTT